MHEATATAPWTTVELGILLRNAGRMPLEWLSEKLGRPQREVEEVAARVRATGYPISLTVETCPMCGRRAPLEPWAGICTACRYERVVRRTMARMARVMPLLSTEDRGLYAMTDAQVEGTKKDPMPKPPRIPADAGDVEQMRAIDAYDAELAEWAGRIECRKMRSAQKRFERMRAKATARAASA